MHNQARACPVLDTGMGVNALPTPENTVNNSFQATTLLVVRHGQRDSSRARRINLNPPLSPLGRRQAAAVAAALGKAPAPDAIYSSPLTRALETATAISDRLGLATTVDDRLAEFQVDLDVETSPPGMPDLLAWHADHAGTDGVTLAEFAQRVADFHDEIVARHPGQRVAIVSHAGTIDATLRWALGIDSRSPWQHEFEIPVASITEIDYWPAGRIVNGAPRYAVLNRIGDARHLGTTVSDV